MIKDLESGSKRGPRMELLLCPLQYLESGSRRGPEIAQGFFEVLKRDGQKVIVNKTGGKNKKVRKLCF
jgi:hypothetical protein